MNKSLDLTQKMFPKFVKELKKYVPGVHDLHKGVTEELIQHAEKKLGFKLPDSYKNFLKFWNGGRLFGTGTMILAIHKGKDYIKKEKLPVEDLIQRNQPKQRWLHMPNEYLIIARKNFGDPICLDIGSVVGNKVKVVQWDHESAQSGRAWKSLDDWLYYEMKEGAEIYDYDGNVR